MSSAQKYTPFTFKTSFDELEKSELQKADEEKRLAEIRAKEEARLAEEEENAPPPPPTFSEEELAAAQAQAWEEGKKNGVEETLQGIEQHAMIALQTLTGQFAILQDRQSLANESQAASLARIASEMIRKLMPIYAAQNGLEEIKALVHQSLAPLESKGRVNISIPAELAETLPEKLKDVAHEAGFEGKLVFQPDSKLGPSDIRVDWGRGSAERRVEHAIAEMDEIIDQFQKNHQNAEELDASEAKHDLVDEEPPVVDAAPPEIKNQPTPGADQEDMTTETQNADLSVQPLSEEPIK